MVYTTTNDPSCYPGTTILRNKANIRSIEKLAEFELVMSLTRAEDALPKGYLDYPHYKALHYHLFQDVYNWAGQLRTIRTGKSGHWFCYPEHIDKEMQRIFDELICKNQFKTLGIKEFVIASAHFLAEINAVHPFRDGNGRTQMMFLVLLTENAGFKLDSTHLDQIEVLNAMINSFRGDETGLVTLLKKLIA